MGKIKKIVWFSGSLNQVGGGERLILEGVKYFESNGIRTYILTWDFDEKALFDGTYQADNILVLSQKDVVINSTNLLSKIVRGISNTLTLRRKIREVKPDVIITQTYTIDSIPLYLATLFSPFLYVTFIHGTMFRIPEDSIKYTIIFRKYFNEIRESVTGYRETIPLSPLRLRYTLVRRVLSELLAFISYFAVRQAKRIFVLSDQVRWEVKKLYGKDAIVLKGAFPPHIFDYKPKEDIKQKLGLMDKKMILNINRLVAKKRVDLCIKAFKEITNKRDDVVLVIGGIGPEEHNLKKLVRQLNLESYVKFVDYIPEKELWDYYLCCDVFVQLDIADFNIAPYVALAFGRKVIWSTEMEIDENLKQNRFIFSTDPELKDVAVAIENALTTELCAMNPIEKQILSRYSWDNYFGEILRESERVCKP